MWIQGHREAGCIVRRPRLRPCHPPFPALPHHAQLRHWKMHDRTSEFVSAVETLRKLEGPDSSSSGTTSVRLPPRPVLHLGTREVSKEVKAAITMVAKLYRLAHRKGLFDDPAAEINALTASCKVELQRLDGRMRELLATIAKQKGASASIRASGVSRSVRDVLLDMLIEAKAGEGEEASWMISITRHEADRALRENPAFLADDQPPGANGTKSCYNPLLLRITAANGSPFGSSGTGIGTPFSSSSLSSSPFSGSPSMLPVAPATRRFGGGVASAAALPTSSLPTPRIASTMTGPAADAGGSHSHSHHHHNNNPALRAQRLKKELCPFWGTVLLPAYSDPSLSFPAPLGSQRAHWSSAAEVLRGHVLGATKAFQEALRIRSENLKEQSERRRTLARSTWAPLVDMSTPLFLNHHHQAAPQPQPQPQAVAANGSAVGAPPLSSGADNASLAASPAGIDTATAAGPRRRNVPAAGPASGLSAAFGGPQSSFPSSSASSSSSSSHMAFGPAKGIMAAQPSNYTAQQLARYHDAASRAHEMRQVESTIVELGAMFTRMASLVAEQGETVERIDADMMDTLENVKEAQSQLQQYYESVYSNRGFIVKLFGLAIFVVLLFMLYR